MLSRLDCLSELRRRLDHVVHAAQLPRYLLGFLLGKNLKTYRSEVPASGYLGSLLNVKFNILFRLQTNLDHFSVDDDLSRWTLADFHRLLVKADVGMRKVVFEGVHLLGNWMFIYSFHISRQEITIPCS